MKVNKRLLLSIFSLVFIAVAATVAVVLTKGYTFSPKDGKVTGTGIISVTSLPDGASVYIDGHLTTATNATVPQLSPKTYSVKILKDGYLPWEKQVEVRGGLVSEVKATLFPSLPTIYPLTFNGAINPVLSPDGQKLAFAVPISDQSRTRQRGGVWVWTMSSQPIAFARSAEPHQIVISDNTNDFSTSTLHWSPDSKQLLATFQAGGKAGDLNSRNYLLAADTFTTSDNLRDITPVISSTIKGWRDDQRAKDDAKILAIKNLEAYKVASDAAGIANTANVADSSIQSLGDAIIKSATSSGLIFTTNSNLHWSPDESKFMIVEGSVAVDNKTASRQPTAISPTPQPLSRAKIYDFGTSDGKAVNDYSTFKSYDLPPAKEYLWLPDSLHVILVNDGKIGVAEYDGKNAAEVYVGNFMSSLVFPWPDSSRLVFVTSYPTPTASTPNLFGLNLK